MTSPPHVTGHADHGSHAENTQFFGAFIAVQPIVIIIDPEQP
jgi:hypothetical protein